MALSAVAVLLSVAFVCGTLVFTDTMNTTFDKLFAATSADVTVSAKTRQDDDEHAADRQARTRCPPRPLEQAEAGRRGQVGRGRRHQR